MKKVLLTVLSFAVATTAIAAKTETPGSAKINKLVKIGKNVKSAKSKIAEAKTSITTLHGKTNKIMKASRKDSKGMIKTASIKKDVKTVKARGNRILFRDLLKTCTDEMKKGHMNATTKKICIDGFEKHHASMTKRHETHIRKLAAKSKSGTTATS